MRFIWIVSLYWRPGENPAFWPLHRALSKVLSHPDGRKQHCGNAGGFVDNKVECVWPLAAVLGEGPMWQAAESTLWFVDIKGRQIHALNDRTGERRSFATPEFAAFIFGKSRGEMICGLRSGLFDFDPASGRFELIMKVDAEHAANRLNDGYVDAQGRLWFGTMDDEGRQQTGSLYRLTGTSLARMDSGYVITNGPAMSPDDCVLYHVDTLQQCVYAFDVDAQGGLSRKRQFVTISETGVYPDGPTVDSAGNVWIALFGGWGVRCYSPGGTLLRTIDLPVAQCTKVAFAGEDLRTLYITTASVGLSDAERERQPLAGGLFRTRVEVAGQLTNRFAG
ncbi:MAG: SMP-30/gluconolactonase/LRE family protein [Pseudomonadota bacterium]